MRHFFYRHGRRNVSLISNTSPQDGVQGRPDLVDIFWCDANPASNYMQGAIKTKGAQDNVMRLGAMSLLIYLEVTRQK